METWAIVGRIAAALGGTTVFGLVSWFAIKWLAARFADHLHQAWSHKYDVRLEALRAEFSDRQARLETALASGAAVHLAGQERRLQALEALWCAVIALGERFGDTLSMYRTFTPAELEKAYSDFRANEIIPVLDATEVMNIVTEIDADVERSAPFIGRRLWMLFYAYRAFVSGMAIRVMRGRERRRLCPWDEDEAGRPNPQLAIVRLVLSDDEFTLIRNQPFGHPQRMMEMLEQKMLAEADRIISGKQASEVSAQQWESFGRERASSSP